MSAEYDQTLSMPALVGAPTSSSAWAARVVEWLAVGGVTLLLLPLSWLLRAGVGLDAAEYAVGFTMFHAAHVLNDPHFAVTYLLFYRDVRCRLVSNDVPRAQRVRLALAGVVVPLVLVAWAISALVLRSAQSLGWMVQLMLLLVGWHYAKQGFGVLTVLSARRGVVFSTRERAVVLVHCFAAWGFSWANPSRVSGWFVEKGVVYWSPSRPPWFELATGAVLAVSTLALAHTLLSKWRNEGRVPVTPLLSFVVTIWLWTIFSAIDPLVRYMVPALHSLQYLYFVWLLKRNEARAQEGPPRFGPPTATRLTMLAISSVALGWLLFRGAPSILDATFSTSADSASASVVNNHLGPTPFFAAFFLVVNIHHYFMDHVIWRRENPDTQYLRTTSAAPL